MSSKSSRECPTQQRLNDWLEGRCLLDPQQTKHVASCLSCADVLEELTSGNEFTGFTTGSNSPTTRFSLEEDAFRELRDQLEQQPASKGRTNAASEIENDKPTPQVPDSEPDRSLDAIGESLQRQLGNERYSVREPLGIGGSGCVFLAYDRRFSRDVAIKVLSRHCMRDAQRLLREARALGEIDHPNVVRVFDISSSGVGTELAIEPRSEHSRESPFLVMEYLSGGSVDRMLNTSREVVFEDIAQIIVSAANGLQAAHSRGLIHRDVKPSNLLFDAESRVVKVADFGLAKYLGGNATQVTRTHEMMGTPAYMSPEQVGAGMRGNQTGKTDAESLTNVIVSPAVDDLESLDERTDIYSLGATLYTLLTGQTPFQGNTLVVIRQIADAEPAAANVINPDVPADLALICRRAMEKLPRDRYQTMRQFAEDLERFRSGRVPVARQTSALRKLTRWAVRNQALAMTLVACAFLGFALVVGSVVTAGALWQQNQTIVQQRDQTLRGLCEKVIVAEPDSLALVIEQLKDSQSKSILVLHELWDKHPDERSRLNLACALLALGEGTPDLALNRMGASLTSPALCQVLCVALRQDRSASQAAIATKLHQSHDDLERGKLAILALHLGNTKPLLNLINESTDQETSVTHLLPEWHGELLDVIGLLKTQQPPELVRVACQALGLVDRRAFTPDQIDHLQTAIAQLAKESQDVGIQGAVEWTRQRQSLPEVTPNAEIVRYVGLGNRDENRLRLLRISAGSFQMGAGPDASYQGRVRHPVELTKDFWLADREVTIVQFQAFLNSSSESRNSGAPQWSPDSVISPTSMHPAQSVSWNQAAEFCNWLSKQHELTNCYSKDPSDTWSFHPAADGYRLPSEAEFEFACRAGTTTTFSFGDSMEYFSAYAAWSNNTRIESAICGTLMPNPWGLFDMHGNVWEWSSDWYRDFDSTSREINPLQLEPTSQGRSYRGGGVCTYTGYPDSSGRGAAPPDVFYNNVGFRIARNAY